MVRVGFHTGMSADTTGAQGILCSVRDQQTFDRE